MGMNRLAELLLVVLILALAWAYTPVIVAVVVTALVILGYLGYVRGH